MKMKNYRNGWQVPRRHAENQEVYQCWVVIWSLEL